MNNAQLKEENRPWWGGRASNPVGGAMRSRVGSTPILFRHDYARFGRDKYARRCHVTVRHGFMGINGVRSRVGTDFLLSRRIGLADLGSELRCDKISWTTLDCRI